MEEVRICDICKRKMDKGYVIRDEEYYCSNDCLDKKYSFDAYTDLFDDDEAYWTEWVD